MKVISFFKQNTILTAAWALAILSMFYVHPDVSYIGYIDFRSLLILWCLMVIMQGYMDANVFDIMAVKLLHVTRNMRQLALVLTGMCFFTSMLITNDVALITFVPFSLIILKGYGLRRYVIPILVLETIAANLGSMLTPIGNPQNLYLFNLSEMGVIEFITLMLPYSALSLMGIIFIVLLMYSRKDKIAVGEKIEQIRNANGDEVMGFTNPRSLVIMYTVLFALSILVVLHIVPIVYTVMAVFIAFLLFNHLVLLRVDYGLLMTFMGFFIFTGNMSRVPVICEALTSFVINRELIMGTCVSQVISNVPAALLLSDFTDNYSALIQGVNIGGLGTLIASMASLITFKLFGNAYRGVRLAKTHYFLIFTFFNVIFLAVLLYCGKING